MKAKDIMTAPVVAVAPDTALRDIVASMLKHRISGVPVMLDGRLLGVINEGDLLRRFEIGTDRSAAETAWWEQVVFREKQSIDYIRSHARSAKDIMTAPVVTVREDASIQEVASTLAARHIRRLPVMRDDQVLGIVTRADLVKALARKTSDHDLLAEQPDPAIRAQLRDELERQHWWRSVAATFEVRDGVVRFHGSYASASDLRAARIAAENVPGVRRVEDLRRSTTASSRATS